MDLFLGDSQIAATKPVQTARRLAVERRGVSVGEDVAIVVVEHLKDARDHVGGVEYGFQHGLAARASPGPAARDFVVGHIAPLQLPPGQRW